jgi:hypothetical protein
VKLFERNRTRVVLTDDGEKVLRLARIVVGAADEILGIRRTQMREKFDHYAKPTQPETGVTATLIKEINYRRKTESLDSIKRESRACLTWSQWNQPLILQRLTCCPRSCVPTLEAQYSLDVH